MKLTILCDNNTYIDRYYLGEPALSILIEDGNDKVLFDTGYSDVFLRNAELMDISLKDLTSVVISHGHNDHTGGLPYLIENLDSGKLPLYAHPDTFRSKRQGEESIGSPLSQETLAGSFDLRLSSEPVYITPKLVFLGEIPCYFDYEKRRRIGEVFNGTEFEPDLNLDDSALAYVGEKGLYIITGCSHSGICNIIRHAQAVTQVENVVGVIGGFHLFDVDGRLLSTIDYLKDLRINKINPCHCVSLHARAAMIQRLRIGETGVGMVITED